MKGPQGFGLHGSSSTTGSIAEILSNHAKTIFVGNVILRIGFNLQDVNGSPMYPSMHVQTGTWFFTEQRAFTPQVPGHGSTHLFLWQALLDGQSEWTTHSGRQAT